MNPEDIFYADDAILLDSTVPFNEKVEVFIPEKGKLWLDVSADFDNSRVDDCIGAVVDLLQRTEITQLW